MQKAVESAPTSGGADLPSSVASDVAGAFGFFPDVKVHTGGESQKAADSIGARAFTSGSDIHLAAGESPGDTRLMAHEVAAAQLARLLGPLEGGSRQTASAIVGASDLTGLGKAWKDKAELPREVEVGGKPGIEYFVTGTGETFLWKSTAVVEPDGSLSVSRQEIH